MEKLKKKRERSANYTAEEKAYLAELVFEFRNIVEDKRTGGTFLSKKKEIWRKIATKYNSCATSGNRTVEQLKMLYDNWKQKTRKSVAESNKAKYAITSEDLSRALEHVKEDKIQINLTGGGSYKPQSSDNDDKILSIMKDQLVPLPNPFDSGAAFFNDVDNQHWLENEVHLEVELPTENSTILEQNNNNKISKITAQRVVPVIKRKKNWSADSFKRIYFKRKCQVANLEKKKLMQEILQQKQQHHLKMNILNLQLKKM